MVSISSSAFAENKCGGIFGGEKQKGKIVEEGQPEEREEAEHADTLAQETPPESVVESIFATHDNTDEYAVRVQAVFREQVGKEVNETLKYYQRPYTGDYGGEQFRFLKQMLLPYIGVPLREVHIEPKGKDTVVVTTPYRQYTIIIHEGIAVDDIYIERRDTETTIHISSSYGDSAHYVQNLIALKNAFRADEWVNPYLAHEGKPFRLRPEQVESIEFALSHRRNGKPKKAPVALVAQPTGIGKTVIMEEVAERFTGKILIIADQNTLIEQIAERFRKRFRDRSIALFNEGGCDNPTADIIIGSRQTLGGRGFYEYYKRNHFQLIMVDEVHHTGAREYREIISYFMPSLKIYDALLRTQELITMIEDVPDTLYETIVELHSGESMSEVLAHHNLTMEQYIEFLNKHSSFTGVQIDPQGLGEAGVGIRSATQKLFEILEGFNITNEAKVLMKGIEFRDAEDRVITPLELIERLRGSKLVENPKYRKLLGDVSEKLIGIPLREEDFDYALNEHVGFELLLGVSATPWHGDYDIVRKIFHGNILYGYLYGKNGDNGDLEVRYDHMVRNAIQMGDLAPVLEYHILDEGAGGGDIGKVISEEALQSIAQRLSQDDLRQYLSLIKVIFTNSIDNADAINEYFNEHLGPYGYVGEALHSDVPKAKRKDILRDLGNHRINSATAINIFNEGLDFPEIAMIVMLKATLSARVYLQELGRALRIAAGKEGIIVIDLGGNYQLGEQLLQVVDIAKGLSPQIEFYGKRKERRERDHGDRLILDTKVQELFTAAVEKKRIIGDFITSLIYVKANIDAYITAQGSSRTTESREMRRSPSYIYSSMYTNSIGSLQEIVGWLVKQSEGKLAVEDFNKEPGKFSERLTELGLVKLVLPVENVKANIDAYITARGSNRTVESQAMERDPSYIYNSMYNNYIVSLQKIVEWLAKQSEGKLAVEDFNKEPEKFSEQLTELGLVKLVLPIENVKTNIDAYITGRGSNRQAEAQAMGRSPSYIKSTLNHNVIVSLQKIVEWLAKQSGGALTIEDFNKEPGKFSERLTELGLVKLVLPVENVKANIDAYITARGSNRRSESLAMGRNSTYILTAFAENSILSLQKTVRWLAKQSGGALTIEDFNLAPEEFKKKLKELGY